MTSKRHYKSLVYRGREIRRVENYTYLGKIIQKSLGHEEHLENQLLKAKVNAIKLVPFMLRGRGISPSMSRTLIIGAM